MKGKIKARVEPNLRDKTRSGFKKVIRSGVTELLLEFCLAKLIAKLMAKQQ